MRLFIGGSRAPWAFLATALLLGSASAGCARSVLSRDPVDAGSGRLDGARSDGRVDVPDAATCAADIECDDGVFCNGSEQCTATGCLAGEPIDCNDGLPCTTDSCTEPGTCVHGGSDADADRYTAVGCGDGNDCDDLTPSVHPGASEICDGVDNDCSGTADDGTGMQCALGSAARACTTACSSPGMQTCNATCRLGPCVGTAEQCNDCDDDLDGLIDDGLLCRRGTSASCITSCGTLGARTCAADCASYGACAAATEACNDCDDNGNGAVDEGLLCRRGTSMACTTACGTSGMRTCAVDCSGYGACRAATETCNGCDDDGDTAVDEGFACRQASTIGCTTACGTSGAYVCAADCSRYGACAAAEVCNGCDDDGVGGADDDFVCVQDAVGGCTTACGTPGTQTCNGTCTGYSACYAVAEVCGNGCDDDGDSVVDEDCGNDLCSGAVALSTVGMGTTVSGTTVGMSNQSACGTGGDVYYSFTLTRREVVYLDTETASYDTGVALATACTGNIGCNNDSCFGPQSQLVQVLNAGRYYAVVSGDRGETGTFTLRFQHLPTGTGTPVVLMRPATNATLSGTTAGANGLAAQCVPAPGPETMYYFTTCAYAGGAFSASTCSGARWDTVLYFRDATLGFDIDCNDDSCGLQSTLSGTASAGGGLRALYIDGYGSGSFGPYSILYTMP